ncbi:MAG: GTPase [candidate division Zixibacteria bacterium]
MPANLPPQYYELEREFKKENDPREKLRMAKELLAMMPKHKGTDKLQAEMKAKISTLNKQIQGGDKKHGARRVDDHTHIEKEGAAQIILIGAPNSGKSSIVDTLTHAKPLIGDYPYTTREPLAGMTIFETVQYELIDTPPISEEYFESYLANLVRQADLVCIVVDICVPGFEERLKEIFNKLEEKRIILTAEIPDEIEDQRFAYKKTFMAAHKCLDEGGQKGVEEIRRLYPDFIIVPTSILDDESMRNFMTTIFESLGIIRIYTKRVGDDPDFIDPIILPIGGTVEDAARTLHKDFARDLQFAKLWGDGKFEGQRVKNSYVLTDKDIIEFHI